MPSLSSVYIHCLVMLTLSLVFSLLMGSNFGLPHFLMASICGLWPLGFVFLEHKRSGDRKAREDEMLSIESKLRTLEGDVSKINLALKLRN